MNMENLRYFEVEISNNNTIDRSVSGDESDRTILILGTREPESLEEMERFIEKEVNPHEWEGDIRKYVVSITEIDKDEAYENYNIGNIVNPIIFKQLWNQDSMVEMEENIMTKTINITVEVYDGTEVEKIENIVSAALDSNGIDCTYDVEEVDEQI